jgi:hypothetical protein
VGSASTWWLRRRARRRRNGRRRGGTGQGQHGSQCNWPGHGRIREVAGRCCAVHCIAARHRAGQPQHQHGAQHERVAALHHRGGRGRSAGGLTSSQHAARPREPNTYTEMEGRRVHSRVPGSTRQWKPQHQHDAQHERAVALHHRGRTWRSAGGQSTLQPTGKHRVPNAEGQAAAGCALGCIRPGAGLQCTSAARALSDARSEKDPLPRVVKIHPRAQVPPQGRPLPCWRQCALPGAEPEDTAAAIPKEPDAKPAHRQRHGPTRRQSAASRAGGHGACTPSGRPSALGRTMPSTRCTRQGRRCEGSSVVGVCGHKGRFRFLVVGVCGYKWPRLTWTLGRLLANILQRGTTATTRNLPGPHPDVFSYGP